MLNRNLQLSYQDFVQELLTACGENPKVADIPVQVLLTLYLKTEN
jgi:hypothetical protein